MRLLEPDLGEVLDRIAILQLKIDAGMKRSISTQQWEEEQKQLDDYLQKKIQVFQRVATSFSMDTFSQYNGELLAVNAKLWISEDEIRKYRRYDEQEMQSKSADIAAIALRIADLNDIRADLVVKINRLFGVETREKLYVQ
jgi:hypothetical protein